MFANTVIGARLCSPAEKLSLQLCFLRTLNLLCPIAVTGPCLGMSSLASTNPQLTSYWVGTPFFRSHASHGQHCPWSDPEFTSRGQKFEGMNGLGWSPLLFTHPGCNLTAVRCFQLPTWEQSPAETGTPSMVSGVGEIVWGLFCKWKTLPSRSKKWL